MFYTIEGNVTPLKHLVPVSAALSAITHFWLGMGALVIAVLSGLLPVYTWLRKPSPDDPWHLLSPMATTSTSASHRSLSDLSLEETAAAP